MLDFRRYSSFSGRPKRGSSVKGMCLETHAVGNACMRMQDVELCQLLASNLVELKQRKSLIITAWEVRN